MSASEHLNNAQFRLFKQVPGGTAQVPLWAHAHDITGHPDVQYTDYDEGVHEGVDDLRYEKLFESQDDMHKDGESLYDSIARQGVQKPVTLHAWEHADGDNKLGIIVKGGHHRLFSAEDLDSERDGAGGRINRIMVPLRYDNEVERHHGSW
jgi:hypothetical protein